MGGVVLVALLVVGGIVWAVTSGGDPQSVEEVADAAVDVAEELDVDAGIDLLCDAPSAEEREELEGVIQEAKDKSGSEDPDADYALSEIEGDAEGAFTVEITSDDPDLEKYGTKIRVTVATDGDRSCIETWRPRYADS